VFLEKFLQFVLANIFPVNQRFKLIYLELKSYVILMQRRKSSGSLVSGTEVVLILQFLTRSIGGPDDEAACFVPDDKPQVVEC